MKRGGRPRAWLEVHDRRRLGERRSSSARAARSLERTPAPRPQRRSGTLIVPHLHALDGPRRAAPSEEILLVTAGVIGLVAFPLAGAALLGHVLPPLGFLVLATIAAVLVFGSVTRLEPPAS